MRIGDVNCPRLGRRAFLQNGTLLLAATATVDSSSRFADEDKERLRVGLITDPHHADKPSVGTRHYRETPGKLAEDLGHLIKSNPSALAPRTVTILTYTLCGFSNVTSIGIQIGGLGSMSPERCGDPARLGLRAMIGGTLACNLTACVAGAIL